LPAADNNPQQRACIYNSGVDPEFWQLSANLTAWGLVKLQKCLKCNKI